jgi:hypothetical protein
LTSLQTPNSFLGRSNVTDSDHETSATDAPDSGDGPPWWHAGFDDEESVEGVGKATQEAVKLAAAVTNWANESGVADILKSVVEQAGDSLRSAASTFAATEAATDSTDSTDSTDRDPHVAATCEVCPICQGVDVLRTVSPETASGIADAMALVTSALRQAMDTVMTEQDSAPPTEPEGGSGVQHIQVD